MIAKMITRMEISEGLAWRQLAAIGGLLIAAVLFFLFIYLAGRKG